MPAIGQVQNRTENRKDESGIVSRRIDKCLRRNIQRGKPALKLRQQNTTYSTKTKGGGGHVLLSSSSSRKSVLSAYHPVALCLLCKDHPWIQQTLCVRPPRSGDVGLLVSSDDDDDGACPGGTGRRARLLPTHHSNRIEVCVWFSTYRARSFAYGTVQ